MSSFAFGSELTVGIEEELLLVDERTLELAPVTETVLDAMDADPRAAGHDAYSAQIELRSPPSSSVGDAVAALAALREQALAAGATLMGSGLHPAAELGDAELVPGSRYELVADELRGLLQRTPESALHVHVGLPDEGAAIRAFNALRPHVPLLLGLAANSPFWFGVDSGLASSRFALSRAYPGRGVPRVLRDVADLEELTTATLAAAGLHEATFLWWDLRLHPRYGTVELREMDAQTSLENVAALAALVRGLVLEAAAGRGHGPDEPSEALAWSAFRAARDGVEATLLHGGKPRPLADVARATVERLRPIARDAGDEDALDGIESILGAGGAARQRTAFATGGMAGLLRSLVEETAAHGFHDASSSSRPRSHQGAE
jgi:glutamate---cysteine ligase / carboxylate-amine ligase